MQEIGPCPGQLHPAVLPTTRPGMVDAKQVSPGKLPGTVMAKVHIDPLSRSPGEPGAEEYDSRPAYVRLMKEGVLWFPSRTI